MRLVRSIAFDALFYCTMGIFGILLAPAAATSRSLATRIIRIYIRCLLRSLNWICGLRIEVRGPVPKGDVIIASKHQSFLDILVLVSVLDRPRFIMKKELRLAPIFGWYARRIGCIAIDRSAGRRALEGMVAAVRDLQGDLGQLVIYPQGTRVAPGVQHPYRSGAAALLAATGLQCVPAATNAGVFWGRNSILRSPGLAVVEFLPTLAAGMDQSETAQRIEEVVEAASRKLEQEAAENSAAG